jgi:hypothetical protein
MRIVSSNHDATVLCRWCFEVATPKASKVLALGRPARRLETEDGSDSTDSRSLEGEPVSYNGAYYKTRKAKLSTRTETPTPIFISALVAKARDLQANTAMG